MMKTSVALCTYNGEKYIESQLISILSQTCPVDEIVVCDDGSTDNTLQIVNQIAQSSLVPFRIVRNDITRMQVDAIVNTANPLPCYGPGTDAAVYEAAGSEKLLAERLKIGVIKPGHSVMTKGFDLPAKYIIHTVGTPWQGGGHEEESIIRSCYKSIFGIVSDNNIESLAIPLLASGSYGFPKGIALRIALSEIEQFMAGHDTELYLVVFDEKSFSLSEELYGDIDDYITDNYVEEKLFSPLPPPGASFPASANMAGSAPLQAKARFSPFKFSGREKRITSDRIDAEPTVFECAEEPLPAACKASADSRSLDDVINNLDKTFMELVFSFADAKGMTDVEVQKKANLDRKAL